MDFNWTEFYAALTKKLSALTGGELFGMIRNLAAGHAFLDYMHFANDALWKERGDALDPFSVLAIFNRGQTDAHRQEIASILASLFKVSLAPPAHYHGIPHLDPRKSIYDGDAEMWALFRAALADPGSTQFATAYDQAKDVKGNGLGTLSIGLFWIRPDKCMAVDRVSIPWIRDVFDLHAPEEKCSGQEYQEYCQKLAEKAKEAGLTFPAITYRAWSAIHP